MPCVAPTHQPASWVFGAWVPTYGKWYLGDSYTAAYSAIMALLMPGAQLLCRLLRRKAFFECVASCAYV